jgi:hypothetical protein
MLRLNKKLTSFIILFDLIVRIKIVEQLNLRGNF